MERNEHIEGWKAQTEYVGEYTHHGKKWCMNFFAVDDADAVVKLQSIKDSLTILGILDSVIKVDMTGHGPCAMAPR